jgi:hypothetical protein
VFLNWGQSCMATDQLSVDADDRPVSSIEKRA